LLDIARGINLEKAENFVIVSEDAELLKKYSLEDFYRVILSSEFSPAQSSVVEAFSKYYGK
ncbi:MAG: hypothetical protein COZ15_03990, partial [Elusimicrobia bacterium CG_4_10_14_3_um_filter_49_12_50_7]